MSNDPFYQTADWRLKISPRQLAREPFCRQCGQPAKHADHITPISRGGARRDADNLQSLCHPCHNQKTAIERQGKTWRLQGVFEDGSPRDPSDPWYTGGHSITADQALRPASPIETE